MQDALIDAVVASWMAGQINPNHAWMSIDVWGYLAKLKDTTGRRIWLNLNPQNARRPYRRADPRGGQAPLPHTVGRFPPPGTFIVGPDAVLRGVRGSPRVHARG